MEKSIEAGYLSQLFSESLYLTGYETEVAEENSIEYKVVEQPKVDIQKPHELPPLPKLEIKPIPTIPKLAPVASKIAKKCILLFQSNSDALQPEEQALVDKIMDSCKLLKEDYEVINFSGLTIHQIAERFSYTKLILFNVEVDARLKLEKYKCTLVKSTQIIYADDVWMIASNDNLKKMLWLQLKVMFQLV